MIGRLVSKIIGTKNDREVRRYRKVVELINAKEAWAQSLSAECFRECTQSFKERVEQGESLQTILVEAFALAREAAFRTLGERHYDVQLIGALALHEGKICEMKTGEGKTLSSVPAAYVNSLSNKGVHIVTVNDYLAQRDAEWMGPVYEYLGVSVGVVLPHMNDQERKKAYTCDITYITNNELGFDYLRDNMAWDLKQKSQRVLNYCIIDEIDSVLIDEARTPLIISGLPEGGTEIYFQAASVVPFLKECEKDATTGRYPEEGLVGDYKLEEKGRRVLLSEEGIKKIEKLLQERRIIQGSLQSPKNLEFVHHVTQALRAKYLYHLDRDYVIREKKVEIVDEFTGRVLEGRRYSEGLHQAIEVKENLPVAQANRTLASITFQNFFRMYAKLSGMTGTADTEAKEFHKIYGLKVVVIPTNQPVAREDLHDVIYVNEKRKFQAIAEEVKRVYSLGQPVLVGTASIEKSEKLSRLFTQLGIRHEVLNAKNHHKEAVIISQAGARGAVTIATNMAGRGTDIKLGGSLEHRVRLKAGSEATAQELLAATEIERPKWQKDFEEVKSLGGLYVIGSERHESRRIDNQLRGRSGRQGDPGRSQFYVSLEDDLMRLFGGDRLRKMVARFGIKEEEVFTGGIFSRTLENAQRRVEDRNFEIRKHLLEYDDVVAQQRQFIYAQRDEILGDSNLLQRAQTSVDEYVDLLCEPFVKQNELSGACKQDLKNAFLATFAFYPGLEEVVNSFNDLLTIREGLKEKAKLNLQEKEHLLGKENFNFFIRGEYIRAIDKFWQSHLEGLDALREAVYLRTYAQKNPLTEYKNEGFSLFNTLIEKIRKTVLSRLLQVEITLKNETSKILEENPSLASARMKHMDFNAFSAGLSGQNSSSLRNSKEVQSFQPIRNTDKVGRNEPCPCGSGRKYKQCHGKGT